METRNLFAYNKHCAFRTGKLHNILGKGLFNMTNSKVAARGTAADTLSWGTRLSYGCGDVACNIVMAGMVNSLLTLFYTDYANVPIATVGLVMLISRFFDGTSDVIIGVLVNRTHSRRGKARPWLLWMALPYVICSISLFCVPQTSTTLQFWYIFVTYNLLATVCYTAINVPYGTLSTLIAIQTNTAPSARIQRANIIVNFLCHATA